MRGIYILGIFQLLFFPSLTSALTYNKDFTIPLPDRAEDLQDIQPLVDSGGFGIGAQIYTGAYILPSNCGKEQDDIPSMNRCIPFFDAGFDKSTLGGHPYIDTIKKEEFLSKKEFHVYAGSLVSFYNFSSHPLWVTSDDANMGNKAGGQIFDQGSAAQLDSGVLYQDKKPVFQYRFETAGRYEFYNKLYPYLRGIIIVDETGAPSKSVMQEPSKKTEEKQLVPDNKTIVVPAPIVVPVTTIKKNIQVETKKVQIKKPVPPAPVKINVPQKKQPISIKPVPAKTVQKVPQKTVKVVPAKKK